MEKEKKEERLLGAQEILFYAMNEASPKHFLMAAEVEGHSTKSAWESAVSKLQQIHPILTMSIVASQDNLLLSGSGEVNLPLDVVDLSQAFDLNRAIEEELEYGFQSDKGPLARIKLFYSAQKCVVIIAAHHSISDALSSVYLLDDLLEILSGKEMQKYHLQPSVDEFLGFSNQGLAAKINEQIKPGQPLPHDFVKQHPPVKADILHFSKELTAQLMYHAKSNATTVHGALQAAAAISLKELAFNTERPAYIMSPFSVRGEMDIAADFGLFIDTKIVAVATDLDLWESARLAQKDLADIHTPEFLKSSAEQLRGLISSSDDIIQFIKDHFNFDIMLSNLGRLYLNHSRSELKLNYLAGPFIISGFNYQQAIGVTTYGDKLTITSSSRYPVPGLLSLIKTKIEEACASTSTASENA